MAVKEPAKPEVLIRNAPVPLLNRTNPSPMLSETWLAATVTSVALNCANSKLPVSVFPRTLRLTFWPETLM